MQEIMNIESEKHTRKKYGLMKCEDFYGIKDSFCEGFKSGWDARDNIDNEALNSLIDRIETVKCTGPNQTEVLKRLYEIADEIKQLRGVK